MLVHEQTDQKINKMIENEKLLNYLDKNFDPFMAYVSRFFPLSHKFIEENEIYINWKELSKNKKIKWSFEFIEKFEKNWKWTRLNNNPKVFNTPEITKNILEKYPFKLRWKYLTRNKGIHFSKELITQNENKINWYSFSKNYHIYPFLAEFKDKLNWSVLSDNKGLPWSEELIDKYFDNWNWNNLSLNPCLPWSIDFIEKYLNKWNSYYLLLNSGINWNIEILEKLENNLHWDRMVINYHFPWNLKMVNKFKHKFLLEHLTKSVNPRINTLIKIDQDLIEENLKKVDWDKLSEKTNVKWTEDLIDKYSENLNWIKLSSNPNLPWSIEFLKKYKDNWHWQEISKNNGIIWTEELLEKYKSNLNLDFLISNMRKNKYLKRTKLIKKYIKEVNLHFIINNSNFSLSRKFLDRYKKRLNFKELKKTPQRLPISIDFLEKYESFISLPINIVLKRAFNIKITEELIKEIIKNKKINDT